MENMEKLYRQVSYRQVSNLSLLKKSGIIAATVTFALLGAWFGFSKLSLGAYNEKNLTKQFLAEDSKIFKTIVIEVGSDTVARVVVGTSSMTLTGTSSYPYQPRFEYDGATGRWSFKNAGGTATTAFGTVTADYVAAQIGSTAANYVLQNNGSSSGQLATNITLAGQGSITATFNANGLDITPAEFASVNNASSELQAQVNTKQASLGYTPPANTPGSITAALGYTPPANTLGSITSALGYTPPANTSGSITTALGYTPTNLGNTIELGSETTGNTDNVSEGNTNQYHTANRVNAVIGSSSVGSRLNEQVVSVADGHHFVYDSVSGKWKNATSTASVGFGGITGTPTDNTFFKDNVPTAGKILVGISDTILIPATTTATLSETSTTGRIFNSQTQSITVGSTTSFSDSSSYNRTITPIGNVNLSTTQKKFGNRGGSFDGTGDYITAPDSTDWNFGTGDITWETFLYPTVAVGGTNGTRYWSTDESASTGFLFYTNDGASTFTIATYGGGGTTPTTSGGYTVNTWTHLAFVRVGTSSVTKIYINGVASATGTYTGSSADAGDKFNIGHWDVSGADFQGYKDETRVSNVARYTGDSFVVPTSPFVSDANTLLLLHYETADVDYFSNKLLYVPPGTTTSSLSITSRGTVTTGNTYLLADVNTSVFGLGTTTDVTGTSSSYAGWFNGAVRATAFNVASSEFNNAGEKVKENIKSINIKPDLIDAESEAKQKYIVDNKSAWIVTNQNKYEIVITETGTGTVIKTDTQTMEGDYLKYIELQWASELNRNILIETVQKKHEKEFWQKVDSIQSREWNPVENLNLTRRGFVVEEAPDIIKGDNGKTIDPMAVIAIQQKVLQSLRESTIRSTQEIGSLTAALENQKVVYNEEVDNLYKVINAVIVSLVAVGGVSGWTTMRRKRKGT